MVAPTAIKLKKKISFSSLENLCTAKNLKSLQMTDYGLFNVPLLLRLGGRSLSSSSSSTSRVREKPDEGSSLIKKKKILNISSFYVKFRNVKKKSLFVAKYTVKLILQSIYLVKWQYFRC